MYLEHFGFARHPFRMAPEEDFLYMSRQHSRAFVFMDSAIWSPEGFVVISGEIGSGKTTLLKKMISEIKEEVKLFHIAYTNLQGDDLFQIIMQQAAIRVTDSNKVSMLFAINDHLCQLAARGVPVLLAIDEAQNLTHENLEDIRMLAGMEGPNGPILRVILMGQPELKENIGDIPQLTQRIKLFFHLEGLSLEDTKHYIYHRLTVAGFTDTGLFSEEIIKSIHEFSSGIPRLINKISDGLLLCAFAEDRKYLNASDIEEIKQELMVSNEDILEARKSTLKKPSSAGNTAMSSDNLDALSRIASALESIDEKLSFLSDGESNPKVRLFEDARRRIKDGLK
ncbi:ExeA family protein [Reinekea marinisedimentorum]|uniref:Type II secretory pathway predicted ATPase ExeA n=1 Tax=Reinekea marinisedimentorum TaxID=230495 RepID=A0A4R3IEA8_9GAMM|nr:AAA family ATPase [Reinekea marinisedimentorum]TCS44097.1 type II secretory pathway predicted ATPase ExeA [Reinekea marinisedimentorum]